VREARRWLDEINVLSTNGRVRDRLPGVRHIMPSEGFTVYWNESEALRVRDPELYAVVNDIARRETDAHMRMTLAEWKADVAKNMPRRSRMWRRVLADPAFRARLLRLRSL
jgi:hypothetical protein